MNRILLSTLIICLGLCSDALSQDTSVPSQPNTVLREGFAFELITGTVEKLDDKWYFTTEQEVGDGIKTLQAGSSIELLGSGTLEKIISRAENNKIKIRLQATTTKYHGKNYLFPTAFFELAQTKPVVEEKQPEADNTETEDAETESTETEKPKNDSVLSDDVKSLLSSDWVPNLKKSKKQEPQKEAEQTTEPKADQSSKPVSTNKTISSDFNLVGRTGFITATGSTKTFKIDALGRKINNTSYVILPCSSLEWFEDAKYQVPGKRRYKISGVVTTYQGRQYLLLQRLVRTYNNGNFAR